MQPFKSLPNPIKNQKSPRAFERLLRSFCSTLTVSRSTRFGCWSGPRDEASGFFTIFLYFNFFRFQNLKSVELSYRYVSLSLIFTLILVEIQDTTITILFDVIGSKKPNQLQKPNPPQILLVPKSTLIKLYPSLIPSIDIC